MARETWRLDATEADVTETVQGIIAARLDALLAEEKTLVQAASVVGRVCGWARSRPSPDPHRAAEERLHGLERKELLLREGGDSRVRGPQVESFSNTQGSSATSPTAR